MNTNTAKLSPRASVMEILNGSHKAVSDLETALEGLAASLAPALSQEHAVNPLETGPEINGSSPQMQLALSLRSRLIIITRNIHDITERVEI